MIQAVILVGGLGSRLKSIVSDRPKPMAPICGKPFLEYVVERLVRQDIKNIVLLCGYKGEDIKQYFGNGAEWNIDIRYVMEEELLGTGGAIMNALDTLEQRFILLNGDTLVDFNLDRMLDFHEKKHSEITILAKSASHHEQRYGIMILDLNNKVTAFVEKPRQDTPDTYINCGVYIIEKRVFNNFPHNTFSFEKDFLPKVLGGLSVYSFITTGSFTDIGTPKSYKKFVNSKQRTYKK